MQNVRAAAGEKLGARDDLAGLRACVGLRLQSERCSVYLKIFQSCGRKRAAHRAARQGAREFPPRFLHLGSPPVVRTGFFTSTAAAVFSAGSAISARLTLDGTCITHS